MAWCICGRYIRSVAYVRRMERVKRRGRHSQVQPPQGGVQLPGGGVQPPGGGQEQPPGRVPRHDESRKEGEDKELLKKKMKRERNWSTEKLFDNSTVTLFDDANDWSDGMKLSPTTKCNKKENQIEADRADRDLAIAVDSSRVLFPRSSFTIENEKNDTSRSSSNNPCSPNYKPPHIPLLQRVPDPAVPTSSPPKTNAQLAQNNMSNYVIAYPNPADNNEIEMETFSTPNKYETPEKSSLTPTPEKNSPMPKPVSQLTPKLSPKLTPKSGRVTPKPTTPESVAAVAPNPVTQNSRNSPLEKVTDTATLISKTVARVLENDEKKTQKQNSSSAAKRLSFETADASNYFVTAVTPKSSAVSSSKIRVAIEAAMDTARDSVTKKISLIKKEVSNKTEQAVVKKIPTRLQQIEEMARSRDEKHRKATLKRERLDKEAEKKTKKRNEEEENKAKSSSKQLNLRERSKLKQPNRYSSY